MASFSYVIIDQRGKEKRGSMEGDSEEKVKSALKADGLIPLSVKEQNLLTKDLNFDIGGGIKPRDLSVFCRQFGSVLSAGVTIISALQMLGDQTEKKRMKNAIREIQASVEKGETLAASMGMQPKIFPPILINMVEAGEASGSLEITFERMAIHFEKDSKLKGLIKQAMIYPMVICIVAIGAIVVMMTVVVPNFIAMFNDMDTQLPAITQFVVNISNFMVRKWWLLILIVALVTGGFIALKKNPAGAEALGKVALRIPLFGGLIIKSSSARLTRTLSTMITAGIPLIDALQITARTMDNIIVKKCLINASEEVARGVPLSKPLEYSKLFPPMVYHMISIGEETGNMESMLDRVADYYDEEVEAATKALTTVLEPLVIVIMALVVGVIIMAIMSPMMSLYSSIENA
ncbi:type II secretion system F family protein [Anaerocolumna xylanovorans]|uniref:Type IV pilus assembly protein PilC n=1 Tax=Anaerocolumna xylanovorans DSM 12503 TaxID=1121345 RepID=A0A1M7YMS7_9FIRM|nr:type II secretion system F family protein [Anaerocolumna xylanovorans]SHO53944.1 type IV pilus assembly protein PilC [Anaerocolumna xylanovorans DSM 12503]